MRRAMHIGQTVIGRKGSYRLTQILHKVDNVPTVLKAEVLHDTRNLIPAQHVVVKTAIQGHEFVRDGLIREYNTYNLQSVATSRFIRSMYDVVGDPKELNNDKSIDYPGLVLECFDTTLQDVPPGQYRHNLTLLHAVIRSVLFSSAAFNSENLVNTDIKPDNILISNIDTGHPIVKVGDLGSVYDNGEAYECQPFAMRAPEVWCGLPCTQQSEVWALAATLLVWMNPGILGTSGIQDYITATIWSVAKLMQLFPKWKGRPIDKDYLRDEFRIAEMLSREPDPERPEEKTVKVMTLQREMQALQIPAILRDFFEALLIPESEMRPSASEVLVSKEYLSLRRVALEFVEAEE